MASPGSRPVPGDERGPERRGRGRRPLAAVRSDVLDVATRLLVDEGLPGFSYERVAGQAGVSKTTVYKHWPSLGVLAIEAYAAGVSSVLEIADTGDLRRDLVAHLEVFVSVLRDERRGRIAAELLGAAQTDPALAEAFRRLYFEPRRAIGIAALRSAQERGQLRRDIDLEVLSDQLWGSCMYRLMTGLHPLDTAFVRELVGIALEGARVAP